MKVLKSIAMVTGSTIPGSHYEKDIGKIGEIVHRTEKAVWLKPLSGEIENKNYWVYHDDWMYAMPSEFSTKQIGEA